MAGDIVPISSKQEESQRRCPGNKSIFTGLPTQPSKEVILILLRAPLSPAPLNHRPLESFSFPPHFPRPRLQTPDYDDDDDRGEDDDHK